MSQLESLDKLWGELCLYRDPQLAKVELPILDKESGQYKHIEKYAEHLFRIRSILQKIERNKLYLEKLYVDDLEKGEVLNYHIQALINDVSIYQEKMKCFLDVLKKDVKSDPDSVELVQSTKNKLIEGLEQPVRQIRNPHQHHGQLFLDGDALHYSNLISTINLLESNASPIGNALRARFKDEAINKARKDAEASFGKAQKRWIGNADNLSCILNRITNQLFDIALSDLIYEVCGIRPLEDLAKKNHE